MISGAMAMSSDGHPGGGAQVLRNRDHPVAQERQQQAKGRGSERLSAGDPEPAESAADG